MCRLPLFFFIIFSIVTLHAQNTTKQESKIQLKKLDRAFSLVDKYYIENIDMAPLVEDAIKNMLLELDPHSTYISGDDMKKYRQYIEGKFTGIGVECIVDRDSIIVVDIYKNSSAERAGILPNDRIVRIDSVSLVGLKISDASKYFQGEQGSEIELEIARAGSQSTQLLTLTRTHIPISNINSSYITGDSVWYVKVNSFGGDAMYEFRTIYHSLQPVKAIIVDLRGNTGGLIWQAVEMAEFFLKKNNLITSTVGRSVSPKSYRSGGGMKFTKDKVVFLIDKHSASASELVSGAIQDWDRGIIIGQRSYGKGLVQRRMPLGDGSSIGVTIAKYITPAGRAIQRPYTKGKRDEYYAEDRSNKNLLPTDSPVDDKPKFKTLVAKRVVLGGGGITPDIVIPIDTTYKTTYYTDLCDKAIIKRYANAIINKYRDSLITTYPTIDDYCCNFEVDDNHIKLLSEFAAQNGIKYSSEQLSISKDRVKIDIKALIAKKLFSESAMYRVINESNNLEYQEAIKTIEDWDKIAIPILKGEK